MQSSIKPPHPVRLAGSPLARSVMDAMGWTLKFDGLPTLQGVFVVYPYTSNWDFVYAVLAKWSLGVQLNFCAKDTLFRVPLVGRWIRWLGGIPTVRNAPGGLVGQAVAELQAARREQRYCWLGLWPVVLLSSAPDGAASSSRPTGASPHV